MRTHRHAAACSLFAGLRKLHRAPWTGHHSRLRWARKHRHGLRRLHAQPGRRPPPTHTSCMSVLRVAALHRCANLKVQPRTASSVRGCRLGHCLVRRHFLRRPSSARSKRPSHSCAASRASRSLKMNKQGASTMYKRRKTKPFSLRGSSGMTTSRPPPPDTLLACPSCEPGRTTDRIRERTRISCLHCGTRLLAVAGN
jgi:hypothetical protein